MPSDDMQQKLAESASAALTLLKEQLQSGDRPFYDRSGKAKPESLGYVFGFAQAALALVKVEIRNTPGPSVLQGMLNELEPGKGQQLFYAILDHMYGKEFGKGQETGFSELAEYVSSQGKKRPRKWRSTYTGFWR